MSYDDAAPVPIEKEIAQRARHEHSRPEDEVEGLDDLFGLLEEVQMEFQQKVHDIHMDALLGRKYIDSWGTTQKTNPQAYVFEGDLAGWWNTILESIGIDTYSVERMLKDAHRWQAEEYGVETNKDTIIISKPIYWVKGESAARQEMQRLVAKGLSPAEALDLWLNEYGHGSQTINRSFLAERRGVTQQAVSQNIRQAKEKLDSEETYHLTNLDPHSNKNK